MVISQGDIWWADLPDPTARLIRDADGVAGIFVDPLARFEFLQCAHNGWINAAWRFLGERSLWQRREKVCVYPRSEANYLFHYLQTFL